MSFRCLLGFHKVRYVYAAMVGHVPSTACPRCGKWIRFALPIDKDGLWRKER